jgi:excisionase family DNA binding protein
MSDIPAWFSEHSLDWMRLEGGYKRSPFESIPDLKPRRHHRDGRMSPPAPAGYMTPNSAARALGLEEHRVYNWVYRGRVPAIRIGAYWYVRLDDVRTYKPAPAGWPKRVSA